MIRLVPVLKSAVLLFLVLSAGPVILSGCATLPSEAVGQAVHRYCDTAQDADRAAIRARTQAAAYPHAITVECAVEDWGDHE